MNPPVGVDAATRESGHPGGDRPGAPAGFPGAHPVAASAEGAAVALAGRRAHRPGDLVRRTGPPAVVFGLFIAGWYAFSASMTERRRSVVLPYPHEVWDVAFADAANRAELLEGLWTTTQVAVIGLAIAIVAGMAVATAMSQGRWIERSFYPYAVTLQAIPILALVPLIGSIWGFEFRSRVLVCVIISVFPIITNTLFGLKSAEQGLHDLFTLHGAGRMTRFAKLQLPAALPAVFTGLRISAGLSVIGAIVGEFFFRRGPQGLGILIDLYRNRLEPELMVGAVFWSAVLGIVVFAAFGWIADRATGSWHDSAPGPP